MYTNRGTLKHLRAIRRRRPVYQRLLAWLGMIVLALGLAVSGSRPLLAQAAGPVYALRGTLQPVVNRTYSTIMTTTVGTEYALVGQTPDIELEIVALRNNGPNFAVKIWGDRYAASGEGELETIVVSGILPAEPLQATATPVPTTPPVATATPTPSVPFAAINTTVVNVRSGPDTTYPPIGSLVLGEVCSVIGRNPSSTWWFLTCPGGMSGWVSGELISLGGPYTTVRVIDVAPPPTPAPPATFAGWRSAFYPNRNLEGEPVQVLDLPNINYNWGAGAPVPGMPVDNWSARFERTLDFASGNYEITINVDDGIRFYIDDDLVINDWNVAGARLRLARKVLSGNQRLRVEYFEAGGNAVLELSIRLLSSSNVWQASYFNNTDLTGSPVLTRGEPSGDNNPLDFSWGHGPPAPGVKSNNWSARWVGTFAFEGGDYRFRANVDDGLRVYIDGIRILDRWEVGYSADVANTFQNLGPGNHQITVEYFEATYISYITVRWDRTGGSSGGTSRDE